MRSLVFDACIGTQRKVEIGFTEQSADENRIAMSSEYYDYWREGH